MLVPEDMYRSDLYEYKALQLTNEKLKSASQDQPSSLFTYASLFFGGVLIGIAASHSAK